MASNRFSISLFLCESIYISHISLLFIGVPTPITIPVTLLSLIIRLGVVIGYFNHPLAAPL
jgi:hypothetical protein